MIASALDAIPSESGLLLLLALLISAAGFYRVVYFVSVGYAFSIAGMAMAAAWLFLSGRAGWGGLVLGLGFFCRHVANINEKPGETTITSEDRLCQF